MADTNSTGAPAGGDGGPPSDLGGATAVVLEKVNAPPAAAAPPPASATPPVGDKAPPAASPPPAVAPPPKSIADPPADDANKPAAAPADWPDDWRQKMAGNDKKLLARLERFNSPIDVQNAWRALEQRLSSGEYRRALPNNPTEEELAAFRESNNIPSKPEDYDVNLGNGFVWGEADKPLLDDFTKFAHSRNMPTEMVKSSLEWFAQQQQVIQDEVAQRDENERVTGSDSLRAEWGNGYTGNLSAARNLFEGANASLWDVVMGARAEDGSRLGNKPEFLKFLSSISRDVNPFATLVPDGAGAAPMKSAEARMAEINTMMRDKSGPYWRGPTSAGLQQEWRDLHEAIAKSKGRAA